MSEKLLGHVTHYFDKIGVAVIQLTNGSLKNGDMIHLVGKNDFEQTVDSMQVDHETVSSAKKGSEVAIKVDQPVKEKNEIFKVTGE